MIIDFIVTWKDNVSMSFLHKVFCDVLKLYLRKILKELKIKVKQLNLSGASIYAWELLSKILWAINFVAKISDDCIFVLSKIIYIYLMHNKSIEMNKILQEK